MTTEINNTEDNIKEALSNLSEFLKSESEKLKDGNLASDDLDGIAGATDVYLRLKDSIHVA